MFSGSHPGPVPHLRPKFVGRFYVQPAVEYLAGQGFTTKAVRGCWQVLTRDTNTLIVEADTRAGAIEAARELAEGQR